MYLNKGGGNYRIWRQGRETNKKEEQSVGKGEGSILVRRGKSTGES